MREMRSYGSVRGAIRESRPYRDFRELWEATPFLSRSHFHLPRIRQNASA